MLPLNSTFSNFRNLNTIFHLAQKDYFLLIKSRTNEHHHRIQKFKLIHAPNFILNKKSRFFGPNFLKKRLFLVQKHHHLIQHIRISIAAKIHPEQTILIFRTKFAQKQYLWS